MLRTKKKITCMVMSKSLPAKIDKNRRGMGGKQDGNVHGSEGKPTCSGGGDCAAPLALSVRINFVSL